MDMPTALPDKADANILFAHSAYRLGDCLNARGVGLRCHEVRTSDDLNDAVASTIVLPLGGTYDVTKIAFSLANSGGNLPVC